MSDALQSAGPQDLEGLALARLVSLLGVEIGRPATFLWNPSVGLPVAWQHWLARCFRPILAPALVAAHSHASTARSAEIAELDRALDAGLGRLARAESDPAEAMRLRSLETGRAFLEGKAGMRGHREWKGYAERVASGEAPGHAATLFAVQCALYHLPLAPSLAAYAWFELESGLPSGWRKGAGTGAEALEVFASALPEVRLAVAGEAGDFDDDGPRLRAV